MIGYITRRVLQAILVVFVVTIVVFILLHHLPGGVRSMLGKTATPQQVAQLTQQLGLNQPIPVQYGKWLGNLLQGHLGYSITQNQSVASLIADRLPKTLVLTGLSLLIAVLVAIALGLFQAVRRNKAIDYVMTFLAFVFYATPTFFMGLVLVLLFSVKWRIFPAQAPQTDSIGGLFAQGNALILPVATLVLVSVALFSRYVRASAVDELTEDYARTARAKGTSETRVLFDHVLRNVLIPVVTLLGLSLPWVFSGALVVESVFNYPGMGLLFWQAAVQHDYPILLGVTVIISVATVIGSLVADVVYAALDPRVRYSS